MAKKWKAGHAREECKTSTKTVGQALAKGRQKVKVTKARAV
jgi:hypothetical protein